MPITHAPQSPSGRIRYGLRVARNVVLGTAALGAAYVVVPRIPGWISNAITEPTQWRQLYEGKVDGMKILDGSRDLDNIVTYQHVTGGGHRFNLPGGNPVDMGVLNVYDQRGNPIEHYVDEHAPGVKEAKPSIDTFVFTRGTDEFIFKRIRRDDKIDPTNLTYTDPSGTYSGDSHDPVERRKVRKAFETFSAADQRFAALVQKVGDEVEKGVLPVIAR